MRTLFLQSSFPANHKYFSMDTFVSIPHIICIDLLFTDTDDGGFYCINITTEDEIIHNELHPTKELAINSLKNILNIINNPAHYSFNIEVVDNIRI